MEREFIPELELNPDRTNDIVTILILQGKTVVQAEIDAAAELIDFFRFNAKHAVELQKQQPLDAEGSTNTMLYRGLEVKTSTSFTRRP